MMWKGLRLIPENTAIDFIGQRYIAFFVTAVMIIGSIYLLAAKGLNYGIDFTGGTLLEIETQAPADVALLRESLNRLQVGEVSLQQFGGPRNILIRVPSQGDDPEIQKGAIEKVKAEISRVTQSPEFRRVEFVGPQVGEELKQKGMYAVLFSILGIMAYIWFRFEWQFGVAAILTLVHDVLATLGFMVLADKTFDLSTLAAVLMVAGYSTNDTVVVFDRIREIMRKFRKKPMAEVCNLAVNETLSRTIVTSLTTILALVALWLFGGEVVGGFTQALLFGFVVGTFSSVYVAAAALLYTNLRYKEDDTTDGKSI